MKKKLLIGAVAALFLGASVFTTTSLTQKEQISDLTLANIEAMTLNRAETSTTWSCIGTVGHCNPKCGMCGTSTGASKGTLTGSHSCSF